MKKLYSRFFLTALTCVAVSLSADAEVLTPDQALMRAVGMQSRASKAGAIQSRQLKLTHTAEEAGQPVYYVFNAIDRNGGFLIASADDMAPAMLGYSEKGSIDMNNLPENLQGWLDEYARQIGYARTASVNPFAVASRASQRPERTSIAPKSTSRWNQDDPFNVLCPVHESSGKATYTGCVATAMAQLMYYYKHPAVGQGSTSYTCTVGSNPSEDVNLSMDFSQTKFDWDNMIDYYDYNEEDYTDAQVNAVATLMKACGVSVAMKYGTSSSSATSSDVAKALVAYFKYDKGIAWYQRDLYGLYEWEDLVYDQIDKYGPVYYKGSTTTSGHAFICDGYDADGFFHFNWGWGGISDGYFLLTALAPKFQGIGGSTPDGYNYTQCIIGNVRPLKDGETGTKVAVPEFFCNSFYIPTASSKLGNTFTVGASGMSKYGMFSTTIGTVNGKVGVKIVDSKGEVAGYATGGKLSNTKFNSGYYSFDATLPSSLAAGDYTLTPALQDSVGNWKDIRVKLNGIKQAYMTVEGNTATFKNGTMDHPKIAEYEIISNLCPDTEFGIKAKITNESLNEYYGPIYGLILDADEDVVCESERRLWNVMPNENQEVNYYNIFPSDMPTGDYKFAFGVPSNSLDADYDLISPVKDVTLTSTHSDTKLTFSNMAFDGYTPDDDGIYNDVDASNIPISVTVKATAAYYISPICLNLYYLLGYDSSGKPQVSNSYRITYMYSEPVFLASKGETADLKFNAALIPPYDPEYSYVARLTYHNLSENKWYYSSASSQKVFNIKDPSAINSVNSDLKVVKSETYTLDGVRVNDANLAPGLYITVKTLENGKTVTEKCLVK